MAKGSFIFVSTQLPHCYPHCLGCCLEAEPKAGISYLWFIEGALGRNLEEMEGSRRRQGKKAREDMVSGEVWL